MPILIKVVCIILSIFACVVAVIGILTFNPWTLLVTAVLATVALIMNIKIYEASKNNNNGNH